MNSNVINPWAWQDNFGYAQAVEVKNNQGTLYCSGQAAMDAEGRPAGGSMKEQIELSLQNVEAVISKAGYDASSIVRLNFYTTSVAGFFASYGSVAGWMHQHRITPSSTLVQVTALAFPELSVEIEATAVR